MDRVIRCEYGWLTDKLETGVQNALTGLFPNHLCLRLSMQFQGKQSDQRLLRIVESVGGSVIVFDHLVIAS